MNLPKEKSGIERYQWLSYPLLSLAGIVILSLSSLIQHTPAAEKGEYFYSQFFRYNLTYFVHVIFFIAGLLIGFFTNLRPVAAGISLFIVFPLTSIAEATVYRGSHNLIPLEMIVYFLLALPSVIAIFIGRYFKRRIV